MYNGFRLMAGADPGGEDVGDEPPSTIPLAYRPSASRCLTA